MPQSKSDDYVTPKRVFDEMFEAFGISIQDCFDPCPSNFKLDGLTMSWRTLNFVNPPYTILPAFVDKAIIEKKYCTTIMLLPTKTDQAWFHQVKHNKIHWFKGRLKFVGQKFHATQPHFLVLIK